MEKSPQKYWLETYGCQMNFAESNALEIDLLHHGYTPAEYPEEATVVILNTCSVRKTAESRIWGRLGYFKHIKEQHSVKIVLTGCMAERLIDQELSKQGVDFIIGTAGKNHIISYLTGQEKTITTYEFQQAHHKEGELRSFVPIMNGCNNFCSYCIVPHVRGREVSRDPLEIYDEIAQLEEKGVREITLLGQNVNSYRYQRGESVVEFLDLLEQIASKVQSVAWIRFLSAHPKDLSPELGDLMSRYPAICRHLHLPVQHGSNRILQAMNRKYTREHYLSLVEGLRNSVPDITFSTDLLIGFPGEREEDLDLTLDLMEQVSCSDAFTYYFNPREGTRAVDLPEQLSEELKLQRLKQVIETQRRISREEKKRRIDGIETVLVEAPTKKDHNELLARSEHDDMVILPAEDHVHIGGMYQVRLTGLQGNTFTGEVVQCGKLSVLSQR